MNDDFADNDTVGWAVADLNSGGGDGTWAAASGALACSGVTTTLSGHSGVPDVAQGSILLIDKAALQTVWLDCTATLSAGCDNAGLVFAYVDRLNFWVRIYSKAQQKILDYQVVNGAWTQKNSSITTITAGVAFAMATQVRAGQGSWVSGTCPAKPIDRSGDRSHTFTVGGLFSHPHRSETGFTP
ncbi:MAG: hypothetical protein U1D55_05730 [Phycisphaerae bacterium]